MAEFLNNRATSDHLEPRIKAARAGSANGSASPRTRCSPPAQRRRKVSPSQKPATGTTVTARSPHPSWPRRCASALAKSTTTTWQDGSSSVRATTSSSRSRAKRPAANFACRTDRDRFCFGRRVEALTDEPELGRVAVANRNTVRVCALFPRRVTHEVDNSD
jgi:hypothetical protein